ncbi:MAG: hypothetical protein JSR58_03335 [Verrucomicrobia bacterium]|nr:hypothetical protein [Verrucomicrobiota bacterium]
MTTFAVVTASCFGAAVGAMGAHYFFNRSMTKEEALTLGTRHAINFLSSVTIAVLTKELVSEKSADTVGLVTFFACLVLLGKGAHTYRSNDIKDSAPSVKRDIAIGFASTATALACGFITLFFIKSNRLI